MPRISRCSAVAMIAAAFVFPTSLVAQGTGTIRGRVVDSTGSPVIRATVSVEATGLRAASDERGDFVLGRVPAGRWMVTVRRVGVRTLSAPVSVVAGAETRQDFTVSAIGAVLAPMEVVVGSRAAHTAADELAVPVDVYSTEEIARQGTTETAQILSQLAPSVNFPRQSVSDATEIVRPFTMRGLSPDHSLVLLNGKRRHHTALVHYYGAGMAAGSSGVDLNALPAGAIDHMEVLREGAAAQYGSDAIAGVVNLVLKQGTTARFLTADAGQYMPRDWPHDGKSFDVNGGWSVSGRGSLALFGEYRDRGMTNRAGPDPLDQIVAGDADQIVNDVIVKKNNPVPQPNHHWGDGAEHDVMTFLNGSLPVSADGNTGLYAFGGYSFRRGAGYGYYRQAMSERNWPQIFPIGFLPKFAPDVVDYSAATGLKGLARGWNYDIGGTLGHNGFTYNLQNTLNTSLGPCLTSVCAFGLDGVQGTADDPGIPNQTSFMAGKLELYEAIASLDASREIDIGRSAPLNLAFGTAFRRENYQVIAGEKASWVNGGHADQYGDIAASGSQVFPGFRPEDEANASRNNVAGYLDLESVLVPSVLANLAGRYEHYSDFGSKTTGKLALRWQPVSSLTLRASVSTGFRAPSLNQSYYSSVVTNFRADPVTGNAVPFEVGIFPVASAEARVLGARPLKAESSQNASVGLAVTPFRGLNFTADVYSIAVNDRILLTTFLATDSVAALLRSTGSRAEAAQYFTNALDTRTRGIDLTGNYRVGVGPGFATLTGTYNNTRTKIAGPIPLPQELQGTGAVLFDQYGEGGLNAMTRERPRWRSTVTAQYDLTAWSLMARASSYGKYVSALYSYSADFAQTYSARTIFDAEVGYRLVRGARLSLGGRNLFDTFPERMVEENSFGMFLYPSASPYGFNGRYVYARLEVGPAVP
ncbi:MAG TPA: TonB-dependent receptor [Gemmatimonadaceae bacterium]